MEILLSSGILTLVIGLLLAVGKNLQIVADNKKNIEELREMKSDVQLMAQGFSRMEAEMLKQNRCIIEQNRRISELEKAVMVLQNNQTGRIA